MLKQLTETVYALKVPRGSNGFQKFEGIANGILMYRITENEYDPYEAIDIPFDFEIICLASQATEEEVKMIVKQPKIIYNSNTYFHYHFNEYLLHDLMDSWDSLLTSKECFIINPYSYPTRPLYEYSGNSEELYQLDMNKWQQAEEHVGEYLLIEKIK